MKEFISPKAYLSAVADFNYKSQICLPLQSVYQLHVAEGKYQLYIANLSEYFVKSELIKEVISPKANIHLYH